jgi:hypothetical protein
MRWDINHVIAYGQSLSTGWDGLPLLTSGPVLDCLMLGESVRPAEEAAPRFTPVGAAAFRPLAATAQGVLGETVLESALGYWRRRMLAERAAGGWLLASACGVGGRSIECLSRGAAPELFERLRGCVRLARAAAAAAGLTYGVAALLLLQGESNVAGEGTRDRTAYKTLLNTLLDDVAAELGGELPCVLLAQTSGAYAEDGMGVPQAQLETGLERPGVFLAAPTYPYPEQHGHPDANGYRWLGAQFGKVLHRVVTRGESWRPLHPLSARREGAEVRIVFHVPCPPLALGPPFAGLRRTRIADGGFSVIDAAGPVPVATVALDGADAVRLTLARPPVAGPLTLRYADRAHFGRGALHDSDPARADTAFATGFPGARYAHQDEAALAGQAYPLVNWCVAFTMPVV